MYHLSGYVLSAWMCTHVCVCVCVTSVFVVAAAHIDKLEYARVNHCGRTFPEIVGRCLCACVSLLG